MKERNHKRQLEMIRSLAGLSTDDEPPAHSFSCRIGEVTVCRVDGDRFIVRDERMSLFVTCEREHIEVERWPADPEIWEPGGAQVVLSTPDGLRVVLCDLNPDDAPRLAWFVGVKLIEEFES